MVLRLLDSFFFFNDTATTEIYTLSLHDALPIWLDKVVEARLFRLTCWRCLCRSSATLAEGRARNRDRKSTRLNSSHMSESRMPSSA